MVAPSIFNDVIGPVMRGPSSSHSAAALRIGWFTRAFMQDNISRVEVTGDISGSLPTTYHSQGSEMGLLGGVLGFSLTDERLISYEDEIAKAGIIATFAAGDFGDVHPNTYRLTLSNSNEQHEMIALSTGGGMIEIIEVDGVSLSIMGDRYTTFVYTANKESLMQALETFQDEVVIVDKTQFPKGFILLETSIPLSDELLSIIDKGDVSKVLFCPPVLPIVRPIDLNVPFTNCEEMLAFNQKKDLDLAGLAIAYEMARGNLQASEVIDKMVEIVKIVKNAIEIGLKGTQYSDRILGPQAGNFLKSEASGDLHDLGSLNVAIAYTTALMEVKSSLGVIVAAPTAGSCGGLPATILAVGKTLKSSEEEIAKAFLVGGLIGLFISKDATFSAELGGCQAECGAGTGMAAAAATYLQGGSIEQSLAAASMGIQNILGMVCDPVANRVEVPCLGKNVLAASNALSMSNMALAGFDQVIPLTQVISAMDKVGRSIPHELRCTGLAGLSVTQSSQDIVRILKKQ